jgi:hypothetical protein
VATSGRGFGIACKNRRACHERSFARRRVGNENIASRKQADAGSAVRALSIARRADPAARGAIWRSETDLPLGTLRRGADAAAVAAEPDVDLAVHHCVRPRRGGIADATADVDRGGRCRAEGRPPRVGGGEVAEPCANGSTLSHRVLAGQDFTAHSVGAANIVLKIELNDSPTGGVVLSENGTVVSAHNDALSGAQAYQPPGNVPAVASGSTSSPAYAAGRQARLDYEAWFNSLPDGDYRKGAEFWAANRSSRSLPTCAQPGMSVDWQNGCNAGRMHLADSDARRRAETEFKMGWNSL